LEAYRDAGLARDAAAIIRSWAGEDPRALWERLRAEGPPRCPDGGVEAGEVARWAVIQSSNTMIVLDENWRNAGEGGSTFYRRDDPRRCAEPLAGVDTLPAAIATDARQVDPREVARWIHLTCQAYDSAKASREGWSAGGCFLYAHRDTGSLRYPPEGTAGRVDDLPVPLPALIHPDAREVDPGPCLPPGTVAYMDPPYVGTTGYASDLPRADVVALARRWAAAGAVVCISEAEPIPELVAEGWNAVRIDGERVGQRRTFSRQQAEWLTLNRAPAWVPSVQGALFGGAK
jgi:hypothetical protein